MSIALICEDGREVVVTRKAAALSEVLAGSAKIEHKLDKIRFDVLVNVVDYLHHYDGKAPPEIKSPLINKNLSENGVDAWSVLFINSMASEMQHLHALTNASHELKINPLTHLCCAKIASLIKGQPLNRIKEILKI